MAVRCVIVDDNAEFLAAAGDLLAAQGVSVVGLASTLAEAIQRADQLLPDVMLVDIELGHEDGFDVARRLTRPPGRTTPRVVLISTHTEEDFAELVAGSPAVGFLSKSQLSRSALDQLLAGGRAP
jgi:CheY-like chemotaxis protein